MYKIKKSKNRTPKQLFHLLKNKIIQYSKTQVKVKNVLTNKQILFPKKPNFTTQPIDDQDNKLITKQQLLNRKYINYQFPLQMYDIKLENEAFNLLKYQQILKISDNMKFGKPTCITSTFGDTKNSHLVIGSDKGYLILIKNIQKKQYQIIHQNDNQIMCLDNNDGFLAFLDSKSNILVFEYVGQEFKKVYQFKKACVITLKIKRFKQNCLIFISDTLGNISRVWIKKWVLVRKMDQKILFSSKTITTIIKILDDDLKKNYYYLNQFNNKLIIATINHKNVSIYSYCLNMDSIQKLFLFAFPTSILNEKIILNLEFLEGRTQKNKNNQKSLFLCFGFEDKIFFVKNYLVRNQVIQGDIIQIRQKIEYAISRRMKCKEQIVSIIRIPNQKIIFISKNGYIYYCCVQNIIFMEKFTNFNELNKLQLKCNIHIKQNIPSSLNNQNSPTINRTLYNNSSTFYSNNKIIILGTQNVILCTILDWKGLYDQIKYIETLQLLYYLILLKYCESPYLTRPSSFEGLEYWFPSESVQQKQILLEYYNLMHLEPPQSFADEALMNQLLLPFILKHQINNLSNQQLDSLVAYWEKENPLIIQEIIMSGINKGWQTAIKNAWLRSLIKMVQMGAQFDFPLLKMYGYVVQYEKTDNKIAKKFAKQIIKYIKLGIQKKLKEQIQFQEYCTMVQLFAKIMFEQDLFQYLIKIVPKKLIRLLTNIFTKQSKICIDKMKWQNFLLSCNKTYSQLVIIESSVSQLLYNHIIQNIIQYIDRLDEGSQKNSIKDQLIMHHTVLFYQCQYQFSKNRVYQIVKRLLENDQLMQKIIQYQYPQIVQKGKYQFNFQMQQYLIKLINLMNTNYCLSDEQKREIAYTAQLTLNYDYVSINLMTPLKKYEVVLSKFISSKNQIIKQKLFVWLVNTIESCKDDQKNYEQFNRVVMLRLKDLIQINKEKTRQFVSTYYKNIQKKLISKLEDFPQLQLEYVQLLISQSEGPVEQYLLNLHISLLCKLEPSKIISVLQNFNNNQRIQYNLEDALNLCKQYKVDEAAIYINQKSGEITEALTKHLQMFNQEWFKYKKTTTEIPQFAERSQTTFFNLQSLMQKLQDKQNDELQKQHLKNDQMLYDHLQYMLQMIHKQPQIAGYFQYYNLIIGLLMKLYQSEQIQQRMIARNKNKDKLINKVTDLIGIIILDLVKQDHIPYLIDGFISKYSYLHFRQMKWYFSKSYNNLYTTSTLLNNVIQMARIFLLNLNINVRKRIIKSIYCQANCNLCKRVIFDDQMTLIFECGHIFHMDCIVSQNGNDYCFECIYKQPIKYMVNFVELDLFQLLKERLQKIQQKASNEDIRKFEQKKIININTKRMNKMKVYDKRKQELMNEVQRIELRLELRSSINID